MLRYFTYSTSIVEKVQKIGVSNETRGRLYSLLPNALPTDSSSHESMRVGVASLEQGLVQGLVNGGFAVLAYVKCFVEGLLCSSGMKATEYIYEYITYTTKAGLPEGYFRQDSKREGLQALKTKNQHRADKKTNRVNQKDCKMVFCEKRAFQYDF